ncbi:hypothetical protein [Kiloniella antarctica]|uniref:Uncharacterized protein n=1 Tax=Kiloniella antarctica TaxID=1550907 RepID=A0ABW5BKW0_9PROT
MKERNDWQDFYRQQVKNAERLHQNLHRLPDILPPRIRTEKLKFRNHDNQKQKFSIQALQQSKN